MTDHEIETLGFAMRRHCSSRAMRAELPRILTDLKRVKDRIRYDEMWVIAQDGCLVRLRDLVRQHRGRAARVLRARAEGLRRKYSGDLGREWP